MGTYEVSGGQGTYRTRGGHGQSLYRCLVLAFLVSLVTCRLSPSVAFAAQWPSLFRGVVVADSPLGVRVVSVEDASQAYFADLRPEDVIVRIGTQEIRSIDEFATFSSALKGRVRTIPVLVFRNGAPLELTVHLYSYPILRRWGIEVVPDYDIRFAQPEVGLNYWRRLGRGYEDAGKPAYALEAYLNALHQAPTDLPTAVKIVELSSLVSEQQLRERQLAGGIASLRQALTVMDKLFDYPLTDEQLETIKRQLQATLESLRHVSQQPSHTTDNTEVTQRHREQP